MRRKILYWTLVTFLFFGLLVYLFWPRDRLTPENLAKVQVGMSLPQIKELLGEPINIADYYPMIMVMPRPDESNGGGAWSWMKSQYESWTSPAAKRPVAPPLVAPAPIPPKPTNPNLP